MSSATPTLVPAPRAPRVPARPPQPHGEQRNIVDYESREPGNGDGGGGEGGLIGWIKSHFWALADQALISGTNFVTGVLTAKALANNKAEFGVFSTIYACLLFANIFQSTLITQAHNVIGASRTGKAYRRYTSSTAFAQLLIVLLQIVLAGGLAIISAARGWPATAMLVALIPSIVFWQFQEFIRRVLYTEHRYAGAFANDIVSYGGQMALIAVMYVAHARVGWHFTGASALYALAVTSAAAVLLGAWQLRHSLGGGVDRHDIEENWHFGKWLLGGELMGWASSLHMQVWWAALLLGTAVSADLRAVQILFGPTRVIAFFLSTILPIRFARTLHKHGVAGMRSQVRKAYIALIPMAGVYCLLLAAFPMPLLHLIYGPAYTDDAAVSVLRLYAGCAFLTYMQMVVAAALTASRRTRVIFTSSVWGCVIALVMSPLCIPLMGADGAIIGIIITTLVVTILLLKSYWRYLHDSGVAALETGNGERAMTVADHPGEALREAPAEVEATTAATTPQQDGQEAQRGELLRRVLDLLDESGVAYCILHGHESLPQRVSGDVDILIRRQMLPGRLAELLRNNEAAIGAKIVQWFTDGAHFVVLATPGNEFEPPVLLQLHISSDFEVSGRVAFGESEILRTRRRSRSGLWIPSAGMEFGCVLANRLNKGNLDARRARHLCELWAEDPRDSREQADRILPAGEATLVAEAASSGDWTPVVNSIESMGKTMRKRLSRREPFTGFARRIGRQFGRARRWVRPRRCGLHVVFLGPDGVGKSTVIDTAQGRIAPAFLHTNYQTFARGILPIRVKKTPHELPPRSLPESLVKAAWWLLCYGPGYLKAVHPTLARGGVAINHRYLIDAVVDPHRYRYSGPTWLIRAIWKVVPQPDLIIFLDAPVDVICRRKQEVPEDKLRTLRDGYLALAKTLPNARVVSTNRSLEATLQDVTSTIFDHMSRRVAACGT